MYGMRKVKRWLFLAVGGHNTTDNSGDNSKQKDEETEADPSLFASSLSRHDSLVRVFDSDG